MDEKKSKELGEKLLEEVRVYFNDITDEVVFGLDSYQYTRKELRQRLEDINEDRHKCIEACALFMAHKPDEAIQKLREMDDVGGPHRDYFFGELKEMAPEEYGD